MNAHKEVCCLSIHLVGHCLAVFLHGHPALSVSLILLCYPSTGLSSTWRVLYLSSSESLGRPVLFLKRTTPFPLRVSLGLPQFERAISRPIVLRDIGRGAKGFIEPRHRISHSSLRGILLTEL